MDGAGELRDDPPTGSFLNCVLGVQVNIPALRVGRAVRFDYGALISHVPPLAPRAERGALAEAVWSHRGQLDKEDRTPSAVAASPPPGGQGRAASRTVTGAGDRRWPPHRRALEF